PLPTAEGGPAPDIRNANTIGFYAPALALVVRGTSRVHTNPFGLMGGKKADAAAAVGADRPDLVAVKPAKKGGFAEAAAAAGEDRDPAKRKSPAAKPAAPDLDPRQVWQDALAQGVENPGLVIACADFLFERGLFEHAAEFLKANLRQGI